MKPKVQHHTPKERLAMRRAKRKKGPAAIRRAEYRHKVLKTLECGCRKTRVKMEPCAAHALVKKIEDSNPAPRQLADSDI